MEELEENLSFYLRQRVRVIINNWNKTAHIGAIRLIVWHYKDKKYNHYVEENRKKNSK